MIEGERAMWRARDVALKGKREITKKEGGGGRGGGGERK